MRSTIVIILTFLEALVSVAVSCFEKEHQTELCDIDYIGVHLFALVTPNTMPRTSPNGTVTAVSCLRCWVFFIFSFFPQLTICFILFREIRHDDLIVLLYICLDCRRVASYLG